MRFLMGSILIVATIIAVGMLFTNFRQTSVGLNSTPSPTVMPFSSPTPGEGLTLTPILTPTPVAEISFEEKWVELDGQEIVYFVPKNLDTTQELNMVIYSHGSTEGIIASEKNSETVEKLRTYTQDLATNHFILAASSLHGENWGSTESLQDIQNLIDYIKEQYPVGEKVNLWGFSMGALPTMLYAAQSPDQIGKIALFAPTVDLSYWTNDKLDIIKSISIKIWHGDQDQNVPYQSPQDFLQKLLLAGVPVEFKTVAGAGHFDLEDVSGLFEFLRK